MWESAAARQAATRWRVRTLGGLEADDGRQHITRFPSRAVATLLARLALAPQRAHGREELIELLWPGVALDVGRNRLRQALSTLRGLLEAPGAPADSADFVVGFAATAVGGFQDTLVFNGRSVNAADPTGVAQQRVLVLRANVFNPNAVPEPGTLALMLAAAAAGLTLRRRGRAGLRRVAG